MNLMIRVLQSALLPSLLLVLRSQSYLGGEIGGQNTFSPNPGGSGGEKVGRKGGVNMSATPSITDLSHSFPRLLSQFITHLHIIQ